MKRLKKQANELDDIFGFSKFKNFFESFKNNYNGEVMQ